MMTSYVEKIIVITTQLFQNRIQKVFNEAYEGLDKQEAIMRNIYEQTYDVRADLNDALLMFCQVWFLEISHNKEC